MVLAVPLGVLLTTKVVVINEDGEHGKERHTFLKLENLQKLACFFFSRIFDMDVRRCNLH